MAFLFVSFFIIYVLINPFPPLRTSFGPAGVGHQQLSRVGRARAGAQRLDEDAALRQVTPRPPVTQTSDGGHLRVLLHASYSDAHQNTPASNVS